MKGRYRGPKKGGKEKGGAASKQEVRTLARMSGLGKTRQTLLNLGRSSQIPFLKAPQGPRPGANYTAREMVFAWNSQSGLSGNGLTQTGSTEKFASIAFRFDDLQNAASYSALFDQYRIEKVKLTFKSRNASAYVANTASPNAAVPWGVVVVDRDDATLPTGITQLQQYDNSTAFSGCDSFSVELIPSITPSVFSSAVLGGYSLRDSDSTWLDMANQDILCYGIKIAISPLTLSSTANWTWDIFGEYVISCRKSR